MDTQLARRARRALTFILTAAVTLSVTAVLGAQPAGADPAPQPPPIIDLGSVPVAQRDAMAAFEEKAVGEVLAGHGLPATDHAAVLGWARDDVRAQMWADLSGLMRKNPYVPPPLPGSGLPNQRTQSEEGVVAWFRTVAQGTYLAAAEASVREYLRYSGLGQSGYYLPRANPPTPMPKGADHTGWCNYVPPGPYAGEYDASSVPDWTASMSTTLTPTGTGPVGDLTKASVTFKVWKSATALTSAPDYTRTVAATSAGVASAQLTGLAADTYTVEVTVPSGNAYSASAVIDQLTVYKPVAGAGASGGGWVTDLQSAGKGRGHFAVNVSNDKKGNPQGHLTYSWVDATSGYHYVVRSNSWTGGGLTFTKTSFSALAKATLTVFDPRTGQVLTGLGGGNYRITVKGTDNGTGGSTDTLLTKIQDGSGAVVHQVQTSSGAEVLVGGGNLTVRSK